jgi:Rrf2 family protein
MAAVKVSAKSDYAVRALLELAVSGKGPVKGERLAQAQEIPLKFLENILIDLRHAGIVRSQRGAEGGYWLAKPAAEITIADVIRAVEGPLASVRGEPPESVRYNGAAEALGTLWVAVRANLRAVLEEVTVADVAAGELPGIVDEITNDPGAWVGH